MKKVVNFDMYDFNDFLNPSLRLVNVINIRLVWLERYESQSDALVCSFLSMMRKYSCGYIVQDWRGCYCHVTFVTHCCSEFVQYVDNCIDKVLQLYNLDEPAFVAVS